MDKRHCLLPLTLVLLSGCGNPQPPDTERRPDPQAAALREPLEKARTAAAATEDAAKAEQKALQAADSVPAR